MKILVMGAGAIGSVVGGFMAEHGHDVTLVGRRVHMDTIARDGLHISGIWGDHRADNLIVHSNPDSIDGFFDAVILTVKSFDTIEALDQCEHLIGPDTMVYAYQNGLGNVEAIAKHVGWERAAGVRAIYGVRMVEPGHVDVTVIAEPTAIGPMHKDTPTRPLEAMARAMDAAGLPTVYDPHVAGTIWRKVAYNCALNPLSALLNVPYGALGDYGETRAVMKDVIAELYAVAAARGIALTPATPDEYADHFYRDLLPPTAAHYASMHEDLRQGKQTEIDSLNGAIARFGAEHDVPTPANSMLTHLIRAREAINRTAKG